MQRELRLLSGTDHLPCAFRRSKVLSASSAVVVKELFFHHAIRAVMVVIPAVTNCSMVALSMGSTGLPKGDDETCIICTF